MHNSHVLISLEDSHYQCLLDKVTYCFWLCKVIALVVVGGASHSSSPESSRRSSPFRRTKVNAIITRSLCYFCNQLSHHNSSHTGVLYHYPCITTRAASYMLDIPAIITFRGKHPSRHLPHHTRGHHLQPRLSSASQVSPSPTSPFLAPHLKAMVLGESGFSLINVPI